MDVEMKYVQAVDFEALNATRERWSQELVHAGVTDSCSIKIVKTPAGGGSPAGLHTHEVDQIFYVLSGTMNIEIQGTTNVAGPGTLVVFPARVPHRNWNEGEQETLHLSIVVPPASGDAPFATPVTTATS
jgi:mannose-6-phosphate isomerase-like protein (cupin superfamily)